MAKSKKLYSKAYMQLQLDEMAKKAGMDNFILIGQDGYVTKSEYEGYITAAKDYINRFLAHKQKAKHKTKTDEVVHISKKQWCAALQAAANYVESAAVHSNLLGEDDKGIASSLAMGFKIIAKMIWQQSNYTENEPIKIKFNNPDFEE